MSAGSPSERSESASSSAAGAPNPDALRRFVTRLLEREGAPGFAPPAPGADLAATPARAAAAAALAAKLEARTARIAILGQGYVGLPLAARLVEAGFRVDGIEPDAARAAAIAAGQPPLGPAGPALGARLAAPLANARYQIHTDPTTLAAADVAIVCVPTPLGPDRRPDLTDVRTAGLALGRHLAPGALCVLESTTYPGTTRGAFRDAVIDGRRERRAAHRTAENDAEERIGESGLGESCEQDRAQACAIDASDLFLAYSPEREDPGRAEAEQAAVPKLVGGLGADAEALAAALYASAFAEVHRTEGAEVAEAAKLFENVFRAVNIALVNEAKTVLEALGIDVWRVLDAAATKPFGFMPFQPGPGLGGHCIPIDPFYFAWAAEQAGVPARFVELAGEVNRAMPSYVTGRLEAALEARAQGQLNAIRDSSATIDLTTSDHPSGLRGAHILVLGLAYKPGVADVRESPALDLVDRLLLAGAHVECADPYVARATTSGGAELEAVPLTAERIASADAVLVVTDHEAFDWQLVVDHCRLVVDTRGILRPFAKALGARLVRA